MASHSSFGRRLCVLRFLYVRPPFPSDSETVRTVTWSRLYHWTPYSLSASSRANTSGETSSLISSWVSGRYSSLLTILRITRLSHTSRPRGDGTPSAQRRL